MDFDKPKVYGDTFISDGLVLIRMEMGHYLINVLHVCPAPKHLFDVKAMLG